MDSNEIALQAFLSHQLNPGNGNTGGTGSSYISWIKSQYPGKVVDTENNILQWKNDFEASNVINQTHTDSVAVDLALENDNGVVDIGIDIPLHMKELSYHDTPNKPVQVDNFYVDGEKVDEESEMFIYIPSGLNMLSQFEQDESTVLIPANGYEEATVYDMYDNATIVDLEEEHNEHFSKDHTDNVSQLGTAGTMHAHRIAQVEDLVFSDDSDAEVTNIVSDNHHTDCVVSKGKEMSETEVCMALDALRQANARYANISNTELLSGIGNVGGSPNHHPYISSDNIRAVGERWYEDVEDFQPIDEE